MWFKKGTVVNRECLLPFSHLGSIYSLNRQPVTIFRHVSFQTELFYLLIILGGQCMSQRLHMSPLQAFTRPFLSDPPGRIWMNRKRVGGNWAVLWTGGKNLFVYPAPPLPLPTSFKYLCCTLICLGIHVLFFAFAIWGNRRWKVHNCFMSGLEWGTRHG